ncbi:hypothetical protein ES705_36698 [subsurface metagenome]
MYLVLGYVAIETGSISSVAFSPDGKTVLTGSWDKTARLWDIKPSLEDFQKSGLYASLTTTQKLHYRILTYDQAINLSNANELYEAAEYYNSGNEILEIDERVEYLNNALNLYNKLLTKQKKAKYYTELNNIYTILQELEPANRNTNEQEKILNELMNLNNEEDLLEGADYFYTKGSDSDNDSIKIHYYRRAILLFEKIMKDFPEAEVKEDAIICYNNLSLAQLFTEQYSEALINAKKGLDLKKEEIIYTKLALAYLFNDKFDEAKSIIEDHKNAMVNQISFGEYILNKLEELEEAGITHPDFEKVRELLEQ